MHSLLFFDTYAFFEIIRGNPKYAKYKDTLAITTLFNIAELNYGLKKELSIDEADSLTRKYESFVVDVTPAEILKAMTLKLKHRKFSIPDAIGYTIARKYDIPFLTGDEDFRNIPHVEFVKK
ncbi:MAG: PIN domain-containing protein [Candidatus Nanoarchaeia archaeon]